MKKNVSACGSLIAALLLLTLFIPQAFAEWVIEIEGAAPPCHSNIVLPGETRPRCTEEEMGRYYYPKNISQPRHARTDEAAAWMAAGQQAEPKAAAAAKAKGAFGGEGDAEAVAAFNTGFAFVEDFP